jgi:hypothetical protein
MMRRVDVGKGREGRMVNDTTINDHRGDNGMVEGGGAAVGISTTTIKNDIQSIINNIIALQERLFNDVIEYQLIMAL